MSKYDGELNRTDQSFFMKWDTKERRGKFKTDKEGPFSWKERNRLAQSMTTRQILDTVEFKEDNQARRNRKWKEIRYFWNLTHNSREHGGNLENAFWMYGPDPIPVTQFVMALSTEFKFGNDLPVENHFRWLYWSLEGGKEGLGDWRELLSALTTINFFRMIKRRPDELLVQLFNIYALGAHAHKASRDDMYLTDKMDLRRIFELPVISDYELSAIREMVAEASLHVALGEPIRRPVFKSILHNNRPLVQHWCDLLWKQIPADLRLLALDEIENELIVLREAKIQQYLYRKAVEHKNYYTYRITFRGWARVCASTALVTRQVKQVLSRLLAEVMGNYTMKARCFARIKLFNYIHRNVLVVVGHYEKVQKIAAEAFAKIRWARTKHYVRKALHRWHDNVGWEINHEVAAAFRFDQLMTKCFKAWALFALGIAQQKRSEMIALENQNALRDMLVEAEESAKLLFELEMKKRQDQIEAEKKAKADAAAYRLAIARQRAQAEKRQEQSMLELMQRDLRRRTAAKELKHLKKRFNKEWKKKEEEMEKNARQRAVEYFLDKENKVEVKVRYDRLRRAFYEPPSVDNRDREKIIASVKNIVFLFLEAKMIENKLKLADVIPKFDLDGKGYLSYDEFRNVIKSLECNISDNQITEVIKGVDMDGDGFIELKELEEAMVPVKEMGVESSPWKFYVDPAQDVICYHNFQTGAKVLEHKMTKEIMMDIVKENLMAEYANASKAYAKEEREADWDKRIKEIMAQRIQNMAHLWFGRRLRKKFGWKLDQRKTAERSAMKYKVVQFVGKRMRGFKVRCRFERQLQCTWEKVWDTNTQRLFWFSHQLQVSTWDQPLLFRHRYDDVESPPPWVAIGSYYPSQSDEGTENAVASVAAKQSSADIGNVQYWHVHAKTTLPKKPDGYPLCECCLTNLATRKCIECAKQTPPLHSTFCFSCFRTTHSSPMDFFQMKKPSKIQKFDVDFMLRLSNSSHRWQLLKPPSCDMCKSSKIFAAFYCQTCSLHICRPCHRRTHDVPELAHHELYSA